MNRKMIKWPLRVLAVIVCGCLAIRPGIAGSYTVSILGHSYVALAWSFQDSTIASAFPSPPDGTQIEIYNVGSGTYSVAVYDSGLGGWDHGSYSLVNGTGFYFENNTNTNIDLTVSGSDLSVTSKTFSYSSNTWYFLGYAFLQPSGGGDPIECVYDNVNRGYSYTTNSLGYHSHTGDTVLWNFNANGDEQWASSDVVTTCSTNYTPFWEMTSNPCSEAAGTGFSPQIPAGQGFWLKPVTNTSWTHYLSLPQCGI
jgi:hypothetical protein